MNINIKVRLCNSYNGLLSVIEHLHKVLDADLYSINTEKSTIQINNISMVTLFRWFDNSDNNQYLISDYLRKFDIECTVYINEETFHKQDLNEINEARIINKI